MNIYIYTRIQILKYKSIMIIAQRKIKDDTDMHTVTISYTIVINIVPHTLHYLTHYPQVVHRKKTLHDGFIAFEQMMQIGTAWGILLAHGTLAS